MTDKNSSVTPRLLGWKREQQDNSGLIPGGFLVSLAWEEVSGTQLGDQFGSEAFWKLTQDQRQKVREALKVTLCKTEDMGYQPRFAGARNLVWDSASNTLFMIGFRECSSDLTPWTKYRIAKFGLAKIPKTCKWRDWGWDGDTSSWVL